MKSRIHAVMIALTMVIGAGLAPATSTADEGAKRIHYVKATGMATLPSEGAASGELAGLDWQPTAKLRSGSGLAFAVGTALQRNIRAEVEVAVRETAYERLEASTIHEDSQTFSVSGATLNGTSDTATLMVNLIWTLSDWPIRPYAGAGVGLGWHEVVLRPATVESRGKRHEVYGIDNGRPTVAAQAMAGVAVPVGSRTEVRIGYRAFAMTHSDIGPYRIGYSAQSLEGGITVEF